jgi:uncharacterized protein YecT (DUF1311 family)
MKTARHAVARWRKRIPLIIFAALTLPAFAQTQAEMTDEAVAAFKKADAKLNAVYKKFRATLDEEGQAKLKTAQKAWLVYRDAEAALEADANRGGSIAPMVYAMSQSSTTQARTKDLQGLLDASKEENSDTDANGNAYTGEQDHEGHDDPNQ